MPMVARSDELTAQQVEVGLVYQHMLGTGDAEAYLKAVGVPAAVIQRVLHSEARRTANALIVQRLGH